MVEAIWPLTRVQFGLETTAGIMVAADTLVPIADGTYQPITERVPLEEAFGSLVQQDDVVTARSSRVNLTQNLSHEYLGWLLQCAVAAEAASTEAAPSAWGAGTAYSLNDKVVEGGSYYICIRAHTSAAGDVANGAPDQGAATAWAVYLLAQTYDFEPTLTTPTPLATSTFEIQMTDGLTPFYRRAFAFGSVESFTLNIPADGLCTVASQWFGRAEQNLAAFAAANPLTRNMLSARDWSFYIDDTWAELGTTQIPSAFREASLQYQTGAAPRSAMAGRADKDLAKVTRGGYIASLGLTPDYEQVAADELQKWREGALRFIRLQAGVSGGQPLTTIDLAVRVIETPDQLARDGNTHTMPYTGQMRRDTTSGKAIAFQVVNSIASY